MEHPISYTMQCFHRDLKDWVQASCQGFPMLLLQISSPHPRSHPQVHPSIGSSWAEIKKIFVSSSQSEFMVWHNGDGENCAMNLSSEELSARSQR